jgi:hypothetical protein
MVNVVTRLCGAWIEFIRVSGFQRVEMNNLQKARKLADQLLCSGV